VLYIIDEITFNGYSVYNLDVLYVIAILLGIFVIISKNPIVSVLYLIGLFLSISAYLILTGLNFIGLSYLLVYIGAISILFLFILMLINVRISELFIDSINSIPLAMVGCIVNTLKVIANPCLHLPMSLHSATVEEIKREIKGYEYVMEWASPAEGVMECASLAEDKD
jgi:NADH-ubiquinone oxidoreductase chain 6